jgi:hypothetical protein
MGSTEKRDQRTIVANIRRNCTPTLFFWADIIMIVKLLDVIGKAVIMASLVFLLITLFLVSLNAIPNLQ